MSQKRNIFLRNPTRWVALLTALILSVMVYSFHIGRNIAERYAPLTSAAMEIKYEATIGHLWFEEIISGDRYITLKEVWKHLDLAEWHARAMLGSASEQPADLMPLEDPALRREIEKTLAGIRDFQTIALQRWNAREKSGIGTDVDQAFDHTFENLLADTDRVKTELQRVIRSQLSHFLQLQIALGTIVLLLGLLTGYMIYRHNQQRDRYLSELLDRDLKLEESERRRLTLFDRSNDAIFLVDRETGRYLDANESAVRLTGRSLNELKKLRTLDITGNQEEASARLFKVKEINSAQTLGNITYTRPDNSHRTARLSVIPLDKNTVFGIARDVTEELEIEQQLRRAQKMEAIGHLTGGIAHDFNNILAIILGNVELLIRHTDPGTEEFNRLEVIQRSTERASHLTRQLLGFSRTHTQQIQTLRLNAAIDEMDSLIRRSLTPKIEVVYQLSANLWLTKIDAEDFKDSLLNLVLNARDAMPEGGRLQIETGNCILDREYCKQHPGVVPGEYVAWSVSDNGVGIPADQLDCIFEPFYTTKEIGKGTGLGLSMVFGFIKRSHGHTTVSSTPGSGTNLTFYLPRSHDQPLPNSIDARQEQPAQGSGELILLVDDEQDLLNLARKLLQELGYRVITADNGPDALKLLNGRADIDLLFSDVVMPGGINGYQLAEKAQQIQPQLAVLLTSGYSAGNKPDKGQAASKYPLLRKPYSGSQLAESILKQLKPSEQDSRSDSNARTRITL